MTKKKPDEIEQQIGELTQDLQRVRADFENYRKRVDDDLERARSVGESKAVAKILPLIDILEKAMSGIPVDISDNPWVVGIVGVQKNMEKILDEMELQVIDAEPGNEFNPDLHHAVQFNEQDGEVEVIAEVLQNGYIYRGQILRPAMVVVTRK